MRRAAAEQAHGGAVDRDLRERGIEALAIDALLARIGTPIRSSRWPRSKRAGGDGRLCAFGRAAALFSEEELAQLSARTLHLCPTHRCAIGGCRRRRGAWLAVRGQSSRRWPMK